MDMNDNFYDKDKGEFNTGEDMKIAKILGDDIDNPKYTFRIIESITDKRIESLSKKFYEIKRNQILTNSISIIWELILIIFLIILNKNYIIE